MVDIIYMGTIVMDNITKWRYCPICGEEIIELSVGDYTGQVICDGESDVCNINFDIIGRQDETLISYHPRG